MDAARDELWWRLEQVAHRFRQNSQQDLTQFPVRGAELRVLMLLDGRGPETGSTIADQMGVSRAAASILTKRLLTSNLVDSVTDTHDRRRRVWELTAEGQRMVNEIKGLRRRNFEERWKRLSKAEQEQLVNALEKLWPDPALAHV